MDYVTKWWAICTQCRFETEPHHDRRVIEAEIFLHKVVTGHRLLLQGEITKEVKVCGTNRAGVGKLV